MKKKVAMAEICNKRQLRHCQRKLHIRASRKCHITIPVLVIKTVVPMMPRAPRQSERMVVAMRFALCVCTRESTPISGCFLALYHEERNLGDRHNSRVSGASMPEVHGRQCIRREGLNGV